MMAMEKRRNSKEPNSVAADPLEYTNDPTGVYVQNAPQPERRQEPSDGWYDAIGQREPSPVRRLDYPRDPHRA